MSNVIDFFLLCIILAVLYYGVKHLASKKPRYNSENYNGNYNGNYNENYRENYSNSIYKRPDRYSNYQDSELESIVKLRDSIIISLQRELQTQKDSTTQSNKKSLTLGKNIVRGELGQILASYSILTEYESIALVSSVSRHPSFDLIGIKNSSMDFIEIKSNGGKISEGGIKIKNIIDSKNVNYRLIEARLPGIPIKDRLKNAIKMRRIDESF